MADSRKNTARSSAGILTRRRSSLGNRGGTFGDWLVHAVARRALVVEVPHGVTFHALAGLTWVGFAKRTRNINRPQFSHAPT
jgi:hypothetical protein